MYEGIHVYFDGEYSLGYQHTSRGKTCFSTIFKGKVSGNLQSGLALWHSNLGSVVCADYSGALSTLTGTAYPLFWL